MNSTYHTGTCRSRLQELRQRTRIISLAAAAFAAAMSACSSSDSGTVAAAGTVEVTEVDVASVLAARILSVRAAEGDTVSAGDTLALLDHTTLAAEIRAREAQLSAGEARLRDLIAGARPAEVGRAEAELRSATADVERTTLDLQRTTALLKEGAISQAQHDAAATAARVALARRDAAAEALLLVQEGTREARIAAARAEVEGARAALQSMASVAGDLVLTAPISGTVLAKHAEPGEILAPGVPLLTVGDLGSPWVKVFVAAPVLPKLQTGSLVLAQAQGVDDQLFEGRVVAIDGRAQFTPRVAMTESERADLMFGVKVVLPGEPPLLRAGLPITVHFDTTGLGYPETLTANRRVNRLPAGSVPR